MGDHHCPQVVQDAACNVPGVDLIGQVQIAACVVRHGMALRSKAINLSSDQEKILANFLLSLPGGTALAAEKLSDRVRRQIDLVAVITCRFIRDQMRETPLREVRIRLQKRIGSLSYLVVHFGVLRLVPALLPIGVGRLCAFAQGPREFASHLDGFDNSIESDSYAMTIAGRTCRYEGLDVLIGCSVQLI